MNAMLYVRGRPLDYDLWDERGRRRLGLGRRAALLHALRGQRARRVGVPRRRRPAARRRAALAAAALTKRLLAAAEAAGIPYDRRLQRPRAGRRARCSRSPRSGGQRWSAADALPAAGASKRPEPRGASPARTVLGVELEGDRARRRARTATRPRRERVARAEREVILARRRHRLAAAAACCPASAPADDLRAVGVAGPPRPARRRARTCRTTPSSRASGRSPTRTRSTAPTSPRRMAEWLLRRTGPADLDRRRGRSRFVRTRAGPARRRHPVPHGRRLLRGPRRRRRTTGTRSSIAPVLVTPKARGRLWLRSADPTDKPRIITNSLSEPEDVDSLLAGMELGARDRRAGPARRDPQRGAQARCGGRGPTTRCSRTTCASG